MLTIIFKVVELAIGKYFDYKAVKTNDEVELEKIEAGRQEAIVKARASILSQGAWRFQKFFFYTLALYYAGVVFYSLLWCGDCVMPYAGLGYEWSIAALPAPFDVWSGWMLAYLFLADQWGK
jgi:hypothetical protein